MAERLLDWYDRHRRILPWRTPPGERADPYHVWLSEIMLQQTTVVTVDAYFRKFVARWPTVADLAAADLDDVLRAWAGLGYYARARNLHACAGRIMEERDGHFPEHEEELRRLPGIGPYTAAAIAAIAFGRRATAVDGNVERVMARIFAVTEPLPSAKGRLKEAAGTLVPERRPGDYTQALFDLGATVCTPRKPKCMLCPWASDCAARVQGIQDRLPAKEVKARKPTRYGLAFLARDADGAVLLRRRAAQGLLGGMMEVPSTDWSDIPPDLDAPESSWPVAACWRPLPGVVRHTFSHFHLELMVLTGRVASPDRPAADGVWVPADRLADEALPTLMRKVLAHGFAHADAEGG